MKKPLSYSRHAADVLAERDIRSDWIERTIREPDWTLADPHRTGIDRRFRSIPEREGRVLRVACYESDTEIRIVTAFFDRDARRP